MQVSGEVARGWLAAHQDPVLRGGRTLVSGRRRTARGEDSGLLLLHDVLGSGSAAPDVRRQAGKHRGCVCGCKKLNLIPRIFFFVSFRDFCCVVFDKFPSLFVFPLVL